MNNTLNFAQAANDDVFTLTKAREDNSRLKTIAFRAKEKFDDLVKYYSKDGNASDIGRQQRGTSKKQDNNTLWATMNRNALVMTAMDLIKPAPTLTAEQLKTGVSFISNHFGASTAPAITAANAINTTDASFKVERVSVEFAAHVHNYIAKAVKSAPEAATQVLAKPADYKIPWAENVAPLKSAFDNGELTHEEANKGISNAILDNRDIHTIENGKEYFMKASKFYEMKEAFAGSTQSRTFSQATVTLFNDKALSRSVELEEAPSITSRAPSPKLAA